MRAEALGVSYEVFKKRRQGRGAPGAENIVLIGTALQLSADELNWLLVGEGFEEPGWVRDWGREKDTCGGYGSVDSVWL